MKRRLFIKQFFVFIFLGSFSLFSQVTYPLEKVKDELNTHYSFLNANIHLSDGSIIENGQLEVRDGRIIQVGEKLQIPTHSIKIDLAGKHIYPSFIDLYSNYGLDVPEYLKRQPGLYQHLSSKKGAYGWNEAIRPEINAIDFFSIQSDRAKSYKENGFGIVLSHTMDGIMRGTGTLVSLSEKRENLAVIKPKASTHFSFNKGSSHQDYPTSLMGAVSLLRQTLMDANWYQNLKNLDKEGHNLSLISLNNQMNLPKFFEINDKWDIERVRNLGKEFSLNFIIKGNGTEYQRMDLVRNTGMHYVLPLNFPEKYKIEDADDERILNLRELKHWELAPTNPKSFENAKVPFSLTSYGMKIADFKKQLLIAIEHGLSKEEALKSLSIRPAEFLGVEKDLGSLETGKIANFFITDKDYFTEGSQIIEHWIQGEKYVFNYKESYPIKEGNYELMVGMKKFSLSIDKENNGFKIQVIEAGDTLQGKLDQQNNLVNLSFPGTKNSTKNFHLSGIIQNGKLFGSGLDTNRNELVWRMVWVAEPTKAEEVAQVKDNTEYALGEVLYPFLGYGNQQRGKSQNFIVKNVTIWTNESEGILQGMDLMVESGRIIKIGKNINRKGFIEIDGTGKHLTPGIIDEHSHIAIRGGVNECSQSVTAEVRVKDAINPDDINIYRQLSGGVTTSHLLHGSCNTIGGQTQLIKMKWGASIEEMLFKNWDPFIKFALGENVKRSYSGRNDRFPNTRLGVEQVLMDAFTRAREYENLPEGKRRDLELEALVEILNQERFITCHSYVQSEINAFIKVAEKFGFTINTFTHILEGYKVADKMKKHGSSGSTFSDWWAYKMEVQDAIPYNAYLMAMNGVNVAINSDDAEMARRLNQEASKSIAYTPMQEEEAFKMVSLNPAKMLHIDDRVGSLKIGKDADLVLWSDNPLSIYAKAEKTWVEGVLEFDRSMEEAKLSSIKLEKDRIIEKMVNGKSSNSKGEGQKPVVLVDDEEFCEENHPRGTTIWDSIY